MRQAIQNAFITAATDMNGHAAQPEKLKEVSLFSAMSVTAITLWNSCGWAREDVAQSAWHWGRGGGRERGSVSGLWDCQKKGGGGMGMVIYV